MIEKLFTSKNRVKILQFLLFEKEESYIREMASKLKIPVSAVKREIDNLRYLSIIKKEKNEIKINEKCLFLDELKNIFIKTDYTFYPIKDALKGLNIKFALIFGSFAKGNLSSESDVDLLAIGEAKPSEIYQKIKNAEKKINRDINPVVWTLDNLKKEKKGGFIKDIFKKKIIMIKGGENELRKIVR